MALVKALTVYKMESLEHFFSAPACGVLKLIDENLQLTFPRSMKTVQITDFYEPACMVIGEKNMNVFEKFHQVTMKVERRSFGRFRVPLMFLLDKCL